LFTLPRLPNSWMVGHSGRLTFHPACINWKPPLAEIKLDN